ncbi:hypothetical protein, partial [Salinibacter ruber]|uniref:hypothetical protein n=1 Tax=Salinibacter ruber TaxID=146919 RepID=UPI0021696F9D
LVSLFDHRIDQAGGPDATQFKQKDSLLVEPLPNNLVSRKINVPLTAVAVSSPAGCPFQETRPAGFFIAMGKVLEMLDPISVAG